MKNIVRYAHHNAMMAVMEENKGLHRENCLCHQCEFFYPDPKDIVLNCQIARLLFSFCQTFNVTTPVWECEQFEEKTREGV